MKKMFYEAHYCKTAGHPSMVPPCGLCSTSVVADQQLWTHWYVGQIASATVCDF